MGDVTYSSSDTAEIHHIIHIQGDPFTRRFVYSTCDDNGENCTDDDIENDTFRAHVRCHKTGRLVLSFEMGKGFTIENGNELVFSKTAKQMEAVANGIYKWDLEHTYFTTGLPETELKGNFIINADSTY